MGNGRPRQLVLERLRDGLPGITPEIGAAQAVLVCLSEQGHASGVEMPVNGMVGQVYMIVWYDELTVQMVNAWQNANVATEWAACGLACLLVVDATDYTVIRTSYTGTGFDYWLGDKGDTYPFQDKARLEVSGIRRAEFESDIQARVNAKLRQTDSSDGQYPAYVVVIEFSRPLAVMVEK